LGAAFRKGSRRDGYTTRAIGEAQGRIIDEPFAETLACGTLIEIMRKDPQIKVEQFGTQDDD
jgi:hypothetical protein